MLDIVHYLLYIDIHGILGLGSTPVFRWLVVTVTDLLLLVAISTPIFKWLFVIILTVLLLLLVVTILSDLLLLKRRINSWNTVYLNIPQTMDNDRHNSHIMSQLLS